MTSAATTLYAILENNDVLYQTHPSMEPRVIRDLQPYVAGMLQLTLVSIPCSIGGSDALYDLTTMSLPSLTYLYIDVAGECPGGNPIAFVLWPQQFPSLRTLHLRNVNALIADRVFAQLEELVLATSGSWPDPASIDQLFQDPENLASMQQLEIRNCIGCAPPLNNSLPAPLVAHELQGVTLQDTPSAISYMLSRFAIPSEASVTLIVNLCGGGHYARPSCATILAILPTNLDNLPILGGAARVEVSCTNGAFRIHATSATKGELIIELCTDADVYSPSAHRDLFQQMVQATRVLFRRAPITRLCFRGPIDGVRGSTWKALFDQFSGLQKLKVEDPAFEGSAHPLLSALTTFSPITRRAVCERLDFLVLRCAMTGADVPEAVCRCFQWRRDNGLRGWGEIIENIYVHVGADSANAQAFAMREDKYRKMLRRYAAVVKVDAKACR